MSALAAVPGRSRPPDRRAAARRWDEPPVLLALAAMLTAALALGLLLAPRSPDGDSAEAGFARDMAAHHEQAVRMAELALQRTSDPEIRVLATDIAVSQRHQIGLMRGWLEAWELPAASPQPAMAWMGHPLSTMPGMATAADIARLRASRGPAADEQLLRLMIPHHQGGVLMAEAALERAGRPEVRGLAGKIVAGQRAEIPAMQDKLRRMGKPTVQGTVSMPPGGHGGHGAGSATGETRAVGPDSSSIGRDLARLGPLVLGLIGAAWLGADTLRRRRGAAPDPSGWRLLATGGLAGSSVLHVVLVPEHLAHATSFGLFFVVAAATTAVLAGAVLAWPAPPVTAAGLLITVGLMALYMLFRFIPPPGSTGPETVEAIGLITQATQLAAASGCLVLWIQTTAGQVSERRVP